jgi:hypothetical protein
MQIVKRVSQLSSHLYSYLISLSYLSFPPIKTVTPKKVQEAVGRPPAQHPLTPYTPKDTSTPASAHVPGPSVDNARVSYVKFWELNKAITKTAADKEVLCMRAKELFDEDTRLRDVMNEKIDRIFQERKDNERLLKKLDLKFDTQVTYCFFVLVLFFSYKNI